MHLSVICKASPNIAFVKYWGKRNIEYNLPLNGSISLTLSSDDLYTQTKVILDDSFDSDELIINDKVQSFEDHPKISFLIRFFQSHTQGYYKNNELIISKEILQTSHIHISTMNSFPTAAGLASSASGFACLTMCFSQLYQIYNNNLDQLNALVRQGSGSACRSMYGGFVEWTQGSEESGKDSIAQQLFPSSYWSELRVFILINHNNGEKKIKSTSGMNHTVQTSELLQYRVSQCVPSHLITVKEALKAKNSELLFESIMRESNQLHAVCLDSYPPVLYFNENSLKIIQFITLLNQFYSHTIAAYSFDAGPNAFLFTTTEYSNDLLYILSHIPLQSNTLLSYETSSVSSLASSFCKEYTSLLPTSLYDILCTKGGEGPQIIDFQCNL